MTADREQGKTLTIRANSVRVHDSRSDGYTCGYWQEERPTAGNYSSQEAVKKGGKRGP